MLQDREPIVLCHAACSGGSMIYRMIIANLDLVGVSEVSHRVLFREDPYFPTDPELALLSGGIIADAEFERIFLDRVRHSNEVCRKKKKTLLIREHTHSYFFIDSLGSSVPDNPSWIADQYLKRFDKRIKCIVTVRDPIDCWLSFFANFHGSTPNEFQEHCSKYEGFVRSLSSSYDKQNILLIRYEDIINDQVKQLKRIAEFIDVSFDGKAVRDWSHVSSTGNSGRQGHTVQKRTRRPFGIQLIRDAEKSSSYRYLTEELGYAHLCESISVLTKARAYYIDFRRIFASVSVRILEPIQNWALSRSRVP